MINESLQWIAIVYLLIAHIRIGRLWMNQVDFNDLVSKWIKKEYEDG